MPLMRSCKDVTRLVLQSQDRSLRPLESMSMHLHWLACSSCKHFRDQQRLMRTALDRWKRYREDH